MKSELADPILIDQNNGLRYLTSNPMHEYDHPDVIHYTQYFSKRAQKRNVFARIEEVLENNKNLNAAEKVACIWAAFSKFVPAFIAKAVSLVSDPEHQYYLIQIAYDELGAQNKNLIHSKLFDAALEQANIKPKETVCLFALRKMFASLNENLGKTRTPSGIIGLLLSFEIIAENNIETVFRGLAVDSHREAILSDSLFFKIHRVDEIEHIRHSIANFLMFSKTEEAIAEAKEFFDIGIIFWQDFWDTMAEVIIHE